MGRAKPSLQCRKLLLLVKELLLLPVNQVLQGSNLLRLLLELRLLRGNLRLLLFDGVDRDHADAVILHTFDLAFCI